MYLHIEFADGSNPWLAFGDEVKLSKELRKWKRNYTVEKLYDDKYGSTYIATMRTRERSNERESL